MTNLLFDWIHLILHQIWSKEIRYLTYCILSLDSYFSMWKTSYSKTGTNIQYMDISFFLFRKTCLMHIHDNFLKLSPFCSILFLCTVVILSET